MNNSGIYDKGNFQVSYPLGLNCRFDEIGMSAIGYKRTLCRVAKKVRFAPESGH